MSNESEIKRLEERVRDLEMFLEMTTKECHEQFKSRQQLISAIERLGLVNEIKAELNSMEASE